MMSERIGIHTALIIVSKSSMAVKNFRIGGQTDEYNLVTIYFFLAFTVYGANAYTLDGPHFDTTFQNDCCIILR
jgi:hypothetical protein